MIWTRSAFLTAILLASGLVAAEDSPRKYSAAEFYENTSFYVSSTEFAVSPDGKRLLVTSDATGIFNSVALNLETGEQTPLTESDNDAVFSVSYFPDGARFLYTSDKGGDELNHLYAGGPDNESLDLTPGEGLRAGFVGWVNQGESFIVMSNERDSRFNDLYRYDSETYQRELVFKNEVGADSFVVSPDGSIAVFVKSRTSADNDLYRVSLGGNDSPELMTPHDGDIAHSVYGFMPEGDKLVIGTDAFGEFRQAWTYDLNSGEQALLVDDDWDVTSVSFSPRGRYQVHSVNEDASTKVTITDRASGKAISLPTGLPKGNVGGVRFTPDEKSLVLRINSDTSPGDIFLISLGKNEFRQLTTALNPEINQADLVESSVIRYESFDGLEIPSILYKPKGANAENPVPALVLVHGGPGGQSNTGYDAEVQHLVNHGYAVLAANNRGSDGYGKTFYHLDDRRHGEDDLDDIVMARTYLESLDWVDNDKIGIWGGSYGGYMVMAALAFRPEAFEVGVNVFGVTNWIRTLLSIPDWWEAAREEIYDELGDPNTDDAERLRRISPLFHANNITKPVLVVQGANDPRVLQVESDEMVAAVRKNNVPVEYLLFPDEGHGFNKRENRVTASEAYLSFLNKYLRGNE